ncbi:MAG: hypothetical protein ACYTAO_15245 [Planctomycetota bacterium]|jgi:hypothetical protein
MNTSKHENTVLITSPAQGLKEKFSEWENMLLGNDRHSIRNQIYDMMWDSAVFQCINESRKYAAKDDKGNIRQNKMLHYFINQSFFKTQLLSIRRLADKDFDRVRKSKSYTVYSLYNLIEDMKKNSALFTRENILAVHGLPYDYEKAMAEFDLNADYTKGPVMVPQEICLSEDIHLRMDSIAGIAPDKRSPNDLIPEDIVKQSGDKLANIDELCKYVDKYIAHAATPDSRKVIPDEVERALGKVLNAHKVICETASYIGNKLLFCGFGVFLATPQFDQFEYLDEPVASRQTIEKLREIWDRYMTETEQWNQL